MTNPHIHMVKSEMFTKNEYPMAVMTYYYSKVHPKCGFHFSSQKKHVEVYNVVIHHKDSRFTPMSYSGVRHSSTCQMRFVFICILTLCACKYEHLEDLILLRLVDRMKRISVSIGSRFTSASQEASCLTNTLDQKRNR